MFRARKMGAVMPISSEKKAKLLLATSEAAAAFVEDMGYIRETLAKADRTTPGEIRRLSAVLRRLLIHHDLRSIFLRVGDCTKFRKRFFLWYLYHRCG
jgi:hypothetical protein